MNLPRISVSKKTPSGYSIKYNKPVGGDIEFIQTVVENATEEDKAKDQLERLAKIFDRVSLEIEIDQKFYPVDIDIVREMPIEDSSFIMEEINSGATPKKK